MSYSSTVLGTSGLVSYWKLGESSGTTAADSQGTSNGTYTNGYTLGQPGIPSGDGTSVAFNIGYVAVPGISTSVPVSVECWVYPTSSNQYCVLVAQGPAYTYFTLSLEDNVFNVYAGTSFLASSTPLPINSWTYLAATFGSGFASMYINGSMITFGMISLSPSTSPINIGSVGAYANTNYFAGRMAHVALYNSSLALETIQAHYTAGSSLPAPSVFSRRAFGPRVSSRQFFFG